ncbi:hypothetical protein MNBD_GAMMA12-1692 [hydrothermal vent metagenome]|uniref:Uncharacterized protein n=1 Tax=hydrothermal vent metagenome TaxID=652676 RepID=A0A3B0XVG4_9ZZZZ
MLTRSIIKIPLFLLGLIAWLNASAHDPIFGKGPHVLFKGGVEVSPQIDFSKANNNKELSWGLNLTYGITGDWAAGIELPYLDKENLFSSSSGTGDVKLFTKFRFWRNDSLGVQESAAVLLKVKLDNADTNTTPSLGSGATSSILGLAYGYESSKWYRWASVRYAINGENNTGLRRGDKIFVDFAGGVRLKMNDYEKPDTVWMIELNGELTQRNEFNGSKLANTGGDQWFISPGIFWTKRNFAIKAGIQIPISSSLNGNQDEVDYRAKLVFEWHL